MIAAIPEVFLALMAWYILYRADPRERLGSLVYLFAGIACLAYALASLTQHLPLMQHTLTIEHWILRAGVAFKFLSLVLNRPKGASPDA